MQSDTCKSVQPAITLLHSGLSAQSGILTLEQSGIWIFIPNTSVSSRSTPPKRLLIFFWASSSSMRRAALSSSHEISSESTVSMTLTSLSSFSSSSTGAGVRVSALTGSVPSSTGVTGQSSFSTEVVWATTVSASKGSGSISIGATMVGRICSLFRVSPVLYTSFSKIWSLDLYSAILERT